MLSDCDCLECGPSAECEWREYYLRGMWLEWLSGKVRALNVKVRVKFECGGEGGECCEWAGSVECEGKGSIGGSTRILNTGFHLNKHCLGRAH